MLASERYLRLPVLPQLYSGLPALNVVQDSDDRFKVESPTGQLLGSVVRGRRLWKGFGAGHCVGVRFHSATTALSAVVTVIVNQWLADLHGEIQTKQKALAEHRAARADVIVSQ